MPSLDLILRAAQNRRLVGFLEVGGVTVRAVLIVISVVLMTNQVSASPRYLIGAGTASCGAWLEARWGAHAVGKESWVLGYVSGANVWSGHDYDFLAAHDAPALFAWLDGYCLQHPLETLADATNDLIRDLAKRAAVAWPKPK
jgi:hypothetical protein